jgi:predicted DNA-binding protein (MmcQ/YjbR family)
MPKAAMTPSALQTYCLAKPGAIADFPFGSEVSVFKVAGKMFALSVLDAKPLDVSLKCDPDEAQALRQQYPVAVRPGYHLNKRHWNTVVVDGSIPRGDLEAMIDDSYDLVVASLPRTVRIKLGQDVGVE